MITTLELTTIIREYIVIATGLNINNVIRSKQNSPGIKEDNIVVSIIGRNVLGRQEVVYTTISGTPEDLTETINGDTIIKVSIDAYSNTIMAQDYVHDILVGFESGKGLNFMNANGLGYLLSSSIRDLSSIEQGNWEQRFNLVIDFHHRHHKQSTIEAIRQSEVSYDVDNGKLTGSFNVTP